MLVLTLSLAGTFAFGLSGALAGVRAHLDLFGTVVLAFVAALSGGILRDLLIAAPPRTFRDWRYLAVACAAGLVCFVLPRIIDRAERGMQVFDALGLSLFCVTGATAALADGVGAAQAAIVGSITGIGGGILRDLLLRKIPTVLRQELYAIPALLGASVVAIAHAAGNDSGLYAVLGAAACFALRSLGIRYGLNLPKPPQRRYDQALTEDSSHAKERTGRGERARDRSCRIADDLVRAPGVVDDARDRRPLEPIIAGSVDHAEWPADAIPPGTRVRVTRNPPWSGPWRTVFLGTIDRTPPPQLVRHRRAHDGEREYAVSFDEHQLSANGYRPHRNAVIWRGI